MKRILLSSTVALGLISGGAAWAENFALLVGASTYPNLEERYWLKGPANDVKLVETFLTTNPSTPFQADNVTVLADGVAGKQAPTLAAIRTAFADIAAQTGAGDFVYLHFSGHGSQAPAINPADELDGLDEMFLPVDVGPWKDETGVVENALVDDEIGALIDSIRNTGADVWVVFDSCHSGTATRAVAGAGDETRLRKLDAGALGVPQNAMDDAESKSRALPDPRARAEEPVRVAPAADGQGSLTAFFAAQTNETTPEKRMPKGKKGRVSQGVFTFTLFETLAERPNITYRQLGQELMRKYVVKNLARSTPMFEGDLDQPVFGNAAAEFVQQWPVVRQGSAVTLAAGDLHGIEAGSDLLLMASAVDEDDAAIGTVRVASTDTFSTQIDAESLPEEIPKGAYLRKVSSVVNYGLTVALPSAKSAPSAAVAEVVAVAKEDKLLGARITFVPADQEADIRLSVLPEPASQGDIWMFPSTGYVDESQLATTPRIVVDGKSSDDLAIALSDNLNRIAKALNLLKVTQAAEKSGLSVEAEFLSARFDPEAEVVIEASRGSLDPIKTPRMVPNDVIGVSLKNPTSEPVDFNLLFVGSDYSITFMGNGRLQPGDTLKDDFVLISDKTFGRDRMLVIMSPAKPQTAVEDLAFLEQSEVPTTRGSASDMEQLLTDAGFGDTTRGAIRLSGKVKKQEPQSRIFRLEVDTVPNG